jgi:glutathione S-transferase
MELIGQFDSPFTRRVGITMRLYGMAFTHNRWSVFGNADELSSVNPLIRVPTLVLDDGTALIETSAIIDYLDGQVAAEKRLLPQAEPLRHHALKVVSMASGVSDMAVRLFYERVLHPEPSQAFVTRITRQMEGALHWLETERASHPGATWLGTLTQADIAVACTLRHLREAHPAVMPEDRYPTLATHCTHYEALPVFQDISQPFIPPA